MQQVTSFITFSIIMVTRARDVYCNLSSWLLILLKSHDLNVPDFVGRCSCSRYEIRIKLDVPDNDNLISKHTYSYSSSPVSGLWLSWMRSADIAWIFSGRNSDTDRHIPSISGLIVELHSTERYANNARLPLAKHFVKKTILSHFKH